MTAGSDRTNGIGKSRATNIRLVDLRHLESFTKSSFRSQVYVEYYESNSSFCSAIFIFRLASWE